MVLSTDRPFTMAQRLAPPLPRWQLTGIQLIEGDSEHPGRFLGDVLMALSRGTRYFRIPRRAGNFTRQSIGVGVLGDRRVVGGVRR